MSDSKRKLSDWYIPSSVIALLSPFLIAVIGILGAMFLPHLVNARTTGDATILYVALALGIVGSVLLFLARLPLYRERHFFTFGPRALDNRHRQLYRWAYLLIGVCAFLLVVLILVLR